VILLQYLPLPLLYNWIRKNKNICRLDEVIKYWLVGFFLFGAIFFVIESVIVYLLHQLWSSIFNLSDSTCYQHGACGTVFTLTCAFILIGFTEEAIKYGFSGRRNFL
jgi:small-conductance mechanosensitive channel